jgi:hypothetical protein
MDSKVPPIYPISLASISALLAFYTDSPLHPKKLLDQVLKTNRLKHYAYRTYYS